MEDKKEEIFKNLYPDYQRCIKSLERMAELIPIGCKQKKTKGDNYLQVTRKDTHILIMETIGFPFIDEEDNWTNWISRSDVGKAMKLVNLKLGWKDILKNEIDFDRMIVYGKLKWIYKKDEEEIQKILDIFPFEKPKRNRRYKRLEQEYIPFYKKDFDSDIRLLLNK